MVFAWISAGFDPWVVVALLVTSFLGSFITVALGIGGGVLVLALMATLMPPMALIPVHGAVQVGSNLFRAGVMLRYTFWPPIVAFTIGTCIGAMFGGALVVSFPPAFVQIGVGGFVMFSVLSNPPVWLSRVPFLTGMVSSFLTMFFGATGVFVATFTKSLELDRKSHVATHAMMMTGQHAIKVLAFATMGFAFAPWVGFILAMIAAGFVGTLVGRIALTHIGDRNFKRALNTILLVLSVQLVVSGLRSLM